MIRKSQLKENNGESLLPPRKKITGIQNTSGQDCFSISILHLLAQTEIIENLVTNHDENCKKASCLMANFMSQYLGNVTKIIKPDLIVKNYKSFGLEAIYDTDVGDFLRGVLHKIGENHLEQNQVKNQAFIWIEWKFECPSCQRFLTMNVKDYVLKVKVPEEKPLEKLLEDYLRVKKCPCGKLCKIGEPRVKNIGKYLFLEIDRSILSGKKAF